MAICEICKSNFRSRRGKVRVPRFCSWGCRIKSKDKDFSCLKCNKSYRVPSGSKRKFCSNKCANSYNFKEKPEKKRDYICKQCGNVFVDYVYRKTLFCSNVCKSKYGGNIRGIQLYKPDKATGRGMNWKSQARLARKRDNYTCRVCKRNGYIHKFKVHVHHIIPYRLFKGDYDKANHLGNLVSLCPSCHPKVEAGIITL